MVIKMTYQQDYKIYLICGLVIFLITAIYIAFDRRKERRKILLEKLNCISRAHEDANERIINCIISKLYANKNCKYIEIQELYKHICKKEVDSFVKEISLNYSYLSVCDNIFDMQLLELWLFGEEVYFCLRRSCSTLQITKDEEIEYFKAAIEKCKIKQEDKRLAIDKSIKKKIEKRCEKINEDF